MTQVIWSPLPGSQALAISCPCNEILFEGTRGPGKTDTQIMFFRRFVGMGYGPWWRGIIFDREYKNLDDLVAKSKRWFPLFNDGVKFSGSLGDFKWTWPTGEELLFRQVKREDDYNKYHGHEYPFIGWNELTKYPSPSLYDAMLSCNRSSFLPNEHSPDKSRPLPEIPLVVFSTTNPHGPGHNWVKRRFIDVAPPGQVVKKSTEVFNPRTQTRETVTRTQVRIFGSYKENRYLSPTYIAGLQQIKEPNKRRAWLWGDWDIVAGGALDDLWSERFHVAPRFVIPPSWRLDRSFDWGSSKPFSVCWWAEANGEEAILPNGARWCPPRGQLVQLFEWYGSEEPGTNEGLKMSAREVAQGILAREKALRQGGWIQGTVWPGPADSAIWSESKSDDGRMESIASKMQDNGVTWVPSDKRPGSRVNGLQLLRDRLEASTHGEVPGITFMTNCRATLATLPVLPRDDNNPDDVDSEAEDHAYDAIRYRVLAGSRKIATNIKVRMPT